jgi:hypothetical protein
MIDLYYRPTPNGHKVTMFLEEADLHYRIHHVDISAGDQFKPELLAISPNNRIPAGDACTSQTWQPIRGSYPGNASRRISMIFLTCAAGSMRSQHGPARSGPMPRARHTATGGR